MRPRLILLLPIIVLIAAPLLFGLSGDPNRINLSQALEPPGEAFPLGSDHLGRDLWARIVYGGVCDISLGLIIVLICVVVGSSAGLLAGYWGGPFDSFLILVMDLLMSVPHTILALVLMLHLGYGSGALIIALTASGWVKYARMVRAQAYSLRESEFIVYERFIGARLWIILFKHLAPNVLPPVIGLAALDMGHVLLSIAALGFLGLGLQPPTPEWGTMIMEARPYLMIAPWNVIFPGASIFVYIAFFTVLGHWLQKELNPVKEVESC